ncbi:MAG: hypothetical protein AAF152_07285 [Cyanobacteria bacterium P01_A01_bin.114]
MVRASGQIEQSLTQLQTATEEMGDECDALYQSYFEALSKAGQRQLALAAYHLCTHVYPEQFLALKFSQREKLQRAIRRLGSQLYDQLVAEWVKAKKISQQEDPEDPIATIKQLFLQAETRGKTVDDDETTKLEAEMALRALDSETFDSETFDSETFDSETFDSETFDSETFDDVEFEDAVLDEETFDELTARSQAVEALASELLLDGSLDDLLKGASADSLESASANDPSPDSPSPDSPSPDVLSREAASGAEASGESSSDVSASELSSQSQPPQTPQPLQTTQAMESDSVLSLPADVDDSAAEPDDPPEPQPLDPVQLLKQQIFVEKAIRNVLKAVSETTNYMLQQAKIVPEMPKQLLTAVTESDGVAQSPLKMPHLLKVSVKILNVDEGPRDKRRGDKKRRKPRVVELEAFPEFVIVHLRLSEIEFAEPSVSVWRSRIREQLTKLKKLGRTYQKNQRELAIAQAEDAWRASWLED